MADEILSEVHVSNLFDLRGVVAVVTGGGSVRPLAFYSVAVPDPIRVGNWAHDQLNPHLERCHRLHHRSRPGRTRQVRREMCFLTLLTFSVTGSVRRITMQLKDLASMADCMA